MNEEDTSLYGKNREGDGMVYPCGDDCPFMKQFINEDKDEDIETNHSDGRA